MRHTGVRKRNDENPAGLEIERKRERERETMCPLYSCAIIIHSSAPNPCSHHRSCVSSVLPPFPSTPFAVIDICARTRDTRTYARTQQARGRTAVTQTIDKSKSLALSRRDSTKALCVLKSK